jgi:hypothetical protein
MRKVHAAVVIRAARRSFDCVVRGEAANHSAQDDNVFTLRFAASDHAQDDSVLGGVGRG